MITPFWPLERLPPQSVYFLYLNNHPVTLCFWNTAQMFFSMIKLLLKFSKKQRGCWWKTRRVSWLAKKLPYVSKYIDQVIVWYGNFRQVLVLIVRVFGENFIKSYQCHALQPRPKWPPKKWTRDVTNLKFWSNVPIANIKLLTRFQVHISTSTQTLTTCHAKTWRGQNV